MKRIASTVFAIALSATALQAQEIALLKSKPHPMSQAVLYGGTAFDLGTTWAGIRYGNFKEGNPLLGQRKAVQAGYVIGMAVATDFVTRKLAAAGHPKLATITNFIAGGMHVASGGLNLSHPKR